MSREPRVSLNLETYVELRILSFPKHIGKNVRYFRRHPIFIFLKLLFFRLL